MIYNLYWFMLIYVDLCWFMSHTAAGSRVILSELRTFVCSGKLMICNVSSYPGHRWNLVKLSHVMSQWHQSILIWRFPQKNGDKNEVVILVWLINQRTQMMGKHPFMTPKKFQQFTSFLAQKNRWRNGSHGGIGWQIDIQALAQSLLGNAQTVLQTVRLWGV